MTEALTWLFRLVLGGVFIAAAWFKIKDPADFALNIFHYRLAPGAMINPSAILLPWLELLCGVAIIAAPRLRAGAAWLILLMLVVFTAAVGISVAHGLDISCGCFSPSGQGQRVGWMKIGENAAMIAGAMFLVWRERRASRPSR